MSGPTAGQVAGQVFGLALLTATGVLMLVVSALPIDDSELAIAAVLSLVLATVTFVVWRFDSVWSAVLGLVVALAAVSKTFVLAFGIFQPFSPIEFLEGPLLVTGFPFAVGGGVGSPIRPRKSSAPGDKRLRRDVLVAIGVASVLSTVGFHTTRSTVDAAMASAAVGSTCRTSCSTRKTSRSRPESDSCSPTRTRSLPTSPSRPSTSTRTSGPGAKRSSTSAACLPGRTRSCARSTRSTARAWSER